MQKASKANLLDHFYTYLSEEDWLDGLDSYQSGRVTALTTYEGLISGRVAPAEGQGSEVRLKLHPSGRCIQWIECTCRKNRALGQYCQHIAAFMIHVDREQPALFAQLDSTMPLKPPTMPRRTRGATGVLEPGPGQPKQSGATETIIEHLKGNIHGVSLIAHGPAMRVRIEIKPGHLTHYDLTLDAAAKFLASHGRLENASGEVKELRVGGETAELGTRLIQEDDETIVAERVVLLPVARNSPAKDERLRLAHTVGSFRRLAAGVPPRDERFLVIPAKAAARHIGQEFLFLPGKGYFPLNRQTSTPVWGEIPLSRTFRDDAAAEFVKDGFREYLATGPVLVDENLRDPVILDDVALTEVEILDGGDGWFRLDPRYGKGKGRISMVELMKQWRKKRRRYIRADGKWLKIPDFVTQYDWQLDDAGEALKVDALGLMRFRAAVGDFDHFAGSRRLLQTLRDNLDFVPESRENVEHGTGIELRQYQANGLKWLWWLYQNRLHGLLADEMGLGKTHQAMTLMSAIQKLKPDARFLVICPTTVLDHWLDKIEQFAPNLKPVKYHGTRRSGAMRDVETGHLTMVTSYGIMLRDIRHLAAMEWEAVVLDEAHFVKNNDTATYQAACKLRSRLRLCLTGTPMENHLGELKNLFDFLVPGYLGSDEYFRKHFLQPVERQESPESTVALQKLIHPFKMRRTKENVLPDLPAKVEDLRHCSLSDEQVRMYREIVALKARPLVEQLQNEASPIPYLHVFATLTLLKQICDHPALITGASDHARHESGKFELLKELLTEAMDSGHKVVIFSQYVGMIQIINRHLDAIGVRYVALTGQTRNRGEVIREFQTDPEIKIFVGSLLAGGIGIDLTAASVVIHYDRWWNATKENQATDRVHRIGQNKNVQVLKLVTRGTLEEKIDRMINAKRELFERFMDKDEEIFRNLSRQELIDLLQ